MNLVRRSVSSTAWNVAGNAVQLVLYFVRSVVLARMLPPEVFGIYALAGSIVLITSTLPNFGLGGAFLHRAPETQDEQHAAAIHFVLKSLFTIAWAVLLVLGAFLFTAGGTRTALLLMTATTTVVELAQTPQLILIRRVVHRRLALLNVLNAVLTTAVALTLAWQGATLWALLATDIVTASLNLLVYYIWRPVWRPRWQWSPVTIRYYLNFGSRNFLGLVLMRALDRVDDIWTGLYLGKLPLGFYSKAYAFATYPRSILAAPLNAVSAGTYAELNQDRRRLSQAFFRTNALLVRSGFFLAGVLALIAPEFIRLLLTDKWLPMLDAFRLMLVFTLLDPIKLTVANLFVAVGKPEQVVQARLVQLAVLIVGLFLLGPMWGISGVALAVDIMLFVGISLLLLKARRYVDYSIRRLFAVPALALLVSLLLAASALYIPGVVGSDWRTGVVKVLAFSTAYLITLLVAERKEMAVSINLGRELLRGRKKGH